MSDEREHNWGRENNELLTQILEIDQKILALLKRRGDVASLKVSFDKPTNQSGETTMAGVAKLGVAAPQPMLDDQKTAMHVSPLATDGTPSAFPVAPSASNMTYTVDDPTSVTITPSADFLSCACVGVKGKAGTPTVTGTYTNPDGSTAVGSGQLTITIDPAELDVSSLGVTFDPPVAQ